MAASRIEVVRVEQRPSLSLVAREGDPRAALAFAAAHDHGSRASAALAALIESRLGAHGFAGAESRAHHLGFHVAVLINTPHDAARFIQAIAKVVATPVAPAEPALAAVRARWAALRARSWGGPGEAAAAACSGEPGVLVASGESAEPSLTELETWRKAIHSARASALSALGPRAVLEKAQEALEDLDEWPDEAVANDPWPARDVVAVDPGNEERRLSLALRLPDPAIAVEAARLLGKPTAALSARLAAFEPSWTLERVVGTTRPRGACLRIDVRAPRGDPAPALADVARVALLLEEEADRVAGRARKSPGSLEEGILRPTDPREAAAIAAWRLLSGGLEAGPRRRVISYVERTGRGQTSELVRALERARAAQTRATLELRSRVEAGQGEAWVLLASACGSSGETESDAGLTALAARAVAAQPAGDVVLEPWVTPEGIGVLAHGPRLGPNESPEDHARRVAAALARASVARLSGKEVAETRAELLAELGPGPDRGYWTALEALAPGHPSWLEPRGTWRSVQNASTHAVEVQRRAWLRSPLRVALLANHDEAQARAAHDELERWLRPLRGTISSCRRSERQAPKVGEVTVEVGGAAETRAAAYVAVPLGAGSLAEASLTEWLLNRPGGWLEQALKVPGLSGSARAELLGSDRGAALVIGVGSFDDQVGAAVQQVRAVLDRASKGAARPADFEAARARDARAEQAKSLDPRGRVVDLWLAKKPAAPTLDSLRRFQRALAPSSHVVVFVKRRE